jgi:UTP--glucose-1-phosphate uridylyltransferase
MLPYCARAKDGRLILKPILEVVYESLHDHGYRKFCFVVGRGKRSIEDYFLIDDSAKYSTNSDLQDFYKKIRSSHIMYVQQSSPRGFGDAVLKAKLFAGKDSFLLHAGDDVILSPGNGHIQRLEDAFFSNGADIALLVDRVERPEQYGVIEGRSIGDGLFRVEHLEEKPRRPKTNLAVIATYIFKPSIFCELERVEPDRNGEIQLTDAIGSLVANGKCVAVELGAAEKRIDVGTPESYVACIKDSFDISRSNTDGDVHV